MKNNIDKIIKGICLDVEDLAEDLRIVLEDDTIEVEVDYENADGLCYYHLWESEDGDREYDPISEGEFMDMLAKCYRKKVVSFHLEAASDRVWIIFDD